mgnify:FL=1
MIAESDQFSKQEKHMASALGIVVGDSVNNIAGFMTSRTGGGTNYKQQLIRSWYDAFCGVANSKPHKDHFTKMVRNFQKHCRRFFGTPEGVETVELSIKSILNRDKLVRISDVVGINPITEKPVCAAELVHVRPFSRQTFSEFWADMMTTVNYAPQTVRSTYKETVVDAETIHALGSGIHVVAPGHKIGHSGTPCQPSGEFCSLVVKWSQDKDLKDHLSKWELTILDLMRAGI